ncbi:ABC transporter substrate-binding protein [Zavarzinia aquatilis]|uniref:ABC transporter substrate-binding protein n=2 Tax=Zavarzinia aquatilis TaxID=2211142 RepID=A0A317E057_9PROT|nr:ABC transporter substrate-binding protein [Zavarzinia aquatilis]
MNLCADELVLRLADREQVAAVSFLAREQRISTVADLANGFHQTRGQAEDVVRLRPDLVIAGRYTTRTTVALLRDLGLPVKELDVPVTFEEVEAQIRDVAASLGQSARGEAMIESIRAGLDAIPPRARPLRALVLRPNGVTSGAGSLVDTLLTRAGLVNLGADPALGVYTALPLELVASLRPDILVMDLEPMAAPALAEAVLHHPVLARLPFAMRVIGVPNRLWTCAGPGMVEAVRLLAGAAEAQAPPVESSVSSAAVSRRPPAAME